MLIADAQKDLCLSLATLVNQCGHEVLPVVGSGLEAIQAYHRLVPDLVLMDYALPRLNGASATRMILAKDPGAKIVLTFLPAGPAPPIDTGALAILPKPVELDKLYATLYEAAPRRV